MSSKLQFSKELPSNTFEVSKAGLLYIQHNFRTYTRSCSLIQKLRKVFHEREQKLPRFYTEPCCQNWSRMLCLGWRRSLIDSLNEGASDTIRVNEACAFDVKCSKQVEFNFLICVPPLVKIHQPLTPSSSQFRRIKFRTMLVGSIVPVSVSITVIRISVPETRILAKNKCCFIAGCSSLSTSCCR